MNDAERANWLVDNAATEPGGPYGHAAISLKKAIQSALTEARADMKERCAVFVEDGANGWAGRDTRYEIAAAIRSMEDEE